MATVIPKPEIVLDMSRLLSRIRHKTPTGVDRVEMAYARELLRRVPERLSFGAVHPAGGYGRIPTNAMIPFLDETEHAWDLGSAKIARRTESALELLRKLFKMRPRPVPRATGRRVLVQSSPHHLHNESLTRSIIAKERADLICLLHDLIPIEYPEYARPDGSRLHERRMQTVARLASGIVTNSDSTRQSFLQRFDAHRRIPVRVSHLGLTYYSPSAAPVTRSRPYFVCLGTIEPRKNHLLLLNIWRRLSNTFGAEAIPKLVIIGRRGWENEQIVDMLERCPALIGCVEEHSGIADRAVGDWISGARALLLPSFAEGFGMPVPEALSLGVPVICSDIPALREAGGDIPLYLDPLDGPRWEAAVNAFTNLDHPQRQAQCVRLATWKGPNWRDHVGVVLDLVNNVQSVPIAAEAKA